LVGLGYAACRLPLQRFQRAQDHVIGIGKREHFLAFVLAQAPKSSERLAAALWVNRKQRKDMDDLFLFGRR
jgi:hypothetical protein